jgi:hypothetical protein
MVAPFRRLSPQIVSTHFLYIDFCSHPVRCDKSHTGTPTESCCWKPRPQPPIATSHQQPVTSHRREQPYTHFFVAAPASLAP